MGGAHGSVTQKGGREDGRGQATKRGPLVGIAIYLGSAHDTCTMAGTSDFAWGKKGYRAVVVCRRALA